MTAKLCTARMRDTLARHIGGEGLSGCVALIGLRDEPTVECLGTMAPGDPRPMQPDMIFRIASMSKPITAVAAMILIEECKIRLDDPVDDLLPELASRKVLKRLDGPLDETEPAKRSITTRDLLTFRFGFGVPMLPPGACPVQDAADALDLGQGMPRPAKTPAPDEWMRRFGTLPLMHQPGERWLYHTGSDVLGVLIRRASGQSFETFLQERILDPLAMKDTGFHVPKEKIGRFLPSYSMNWSTGRPELYDPPNGQWSSPPAFACGGGGMVSTAQDYWAFGQMLMNRGSFRGTRILSSASVRLMTSDQIGDEQKRLGGLGASFFDYWSWGFGVGIAMRVSELWTEPGLYGWSGGLGTSWYQSPEAGITGIILTQNAFTSPSLPPIVNDFWTSVGLATHD